MTSRCDRALDRAGQLAREWNAELVVAYVAEHVHAPPYHLDRPRRSWRRLPDPLERMRWRLERDLAGALAGMRVIVTEGNPAAKLAEIAAREGCDLIVTGSAQGDSVERMFMGSTVNRLVRLALSPILMVQDRCRQPYRNVTVATDFSDTSLRALCTASAFFPDARLTLFHAYDVPFSGLVASVNLAGELRSAEREVTAKFLADTRVDPALRQNARIVMEHGVPEVLLGDFAEDNHMDLTVIGSHGRGAAFDVLIGSTAKRMVETLEGDLLIVRHRGG